MCTATSTDTSVELLEALDFKVGCGHSRHNADPRHHGGETNWVCQAFHECRGRTEGEGPWTYPACDVWAEHVRSRYGTPWMCPNCGACDMTEHFVIVLGPLNTM